MACRGTLSKYLYLSSLAQKPAILPICMFRSYGGKGFRSTKAIHLEQYGSRSALLPVTSSCNTSKMSRVCPAGLVCSQEYKTFLIEPNGKFKAMHTVNGMSPN